MIELLKFDPIKALEPKPDAMTSIQPVNFLTQYLSTHYIRQIFVDQIILLVLFSLT
jgi:hypothetical protein